MSLLQKALEKEQEDLIKWMEKIRDDHIKEWNDKIQEEKKKEIKYIPDSKLSKEDQEAIYKDLVSANVRIPDKLSRTLWRAYNVHSAFQYSGKETPDWFYRKYMDDIRTGGFRYIDY